MPLATLRLWQERARARRALAQFSERDLHDIGLSWSSVVRGSEQAVLARLTDGREQSP